MRSPDSATGQSGPIVIAPAQLPVGLIAALVGTRYFVWLLWRPSRG